MNRLQAVAENVRVLEFPLRLVGLLIGRNVTTVIRLRDGRLVIHSTASFAEEDIAAIKALGEPAWLVDATLFHDSFAQDGHREFPDFPYFAPSGFAKVSGVVTEDLDCLPSAWTSELDVVRLDGVKANEHVFYHRASRTLIVCDLFFNFGPRSPGWTRWFARHLMRLRDGMGMSFFFRLMIRDGAAFEQSLREMLQWDFERMTVGHGEVMAKSWRTAPDTSWSNISRARDSIWASSRS